MRSRRSVPLFLLMILAFEKFIQHMFVTYALIVNLGGIRQSLSLDYRVFMISGFLVGILFLAAFIFMIRRKKFSLNLLLYLALFDFFGEFIAQGTLFITITISFLVASLIIIVLLATRKDLISNNG